MLPFDFQVVQDEGGFHDKRRVFYSAIMNDNLIDCIMGKANVTHITPRVWQILVRVFLNSFIHQYLYTVYTDSQFFCGRLVAGWSEVGFNFIIWLLLWHGILRGLFYIPQHTYRFVIKEPKMLFVISFYICLFVLFDLSLEKEIGGWGALKLVTKFTFSSRWQLLYACFWHLFWHFHA